MQWAPTNSEQFFPLYHFIRCKWDQCTREAYVHMVKIHLISIFQLFRVQQNASLPKSVQKAIGIDLKKSNSKGDQEIVPVHLISRVVLVVSSAALPAEQV